MLTEYHCPGCFTLQGVFMYEQIPAGDGEYMQAGGPTVCTECDRLFCDSCTTKFDEDLCCFDCQYPGSSGRDWHPELYDLSTSMQLCLEIFGSLAPLNVMKLRTKLNDL